MTATTLKVGDELTMAEIFALLGRGAPSEAELASDPAEPSAWFCLYTQPKLEDTVVSELTLGGFKSYRPLGKKVRRVRTKRGWRPAEVKRPAFPRYVFVGSPSIGFDWYRVKAMKGVCGAVCEGNRPLRIPSSVIDDIRVAEDIGQFDWDYREPLSAKFHVEQGDHVQITSGTLSGYTARVMRTPTSQNCHVVPDIFEKIIVCDVRDLKIIP